MNKLVLLCTLALGGCFNLGGNSNERVVVNYVLEDATPATSPVTASDPRTLLVPDTTAAAYYDSDTLVYSRSPGTRAKYRYARWIDRPGKRFADLLRTRLAAQSGFAAVASGGQIHGDLLLDSELIEFYHDATASPGNVHIMLRADLIDLKTRALVNRKIFEQRAPLASYDAAGAARAFDLATSRILNDVMDWLAVARQSPPAATAPSINKKETP
jgi:cholesterol transport system auxiliary component